MSKIRFTPIATPSAAPTGKVEIYVDSADGDVKQINDAGTVVPLSIGYTAEDAANKSTSVSTDHTSNVKYPSVKAVYDWALATFQAALGYTAENAANKDTDGTLASNSNTKYPSQAATKTYVDTNVVPMMVDIFTALGSAIKAFLFDQSFMSLTSGYALTSQQVKFAPFYLRTAQTLTGVVFGQPTAGVYTASNYNGIGLYTYVAGTLTLVASTTNDGNIWKTSSATWGTKAFSAPYAAAAGLYFLGFLYSSSAQTTAPSLLGSSANSTMMALSFDFTNSAKLSMSLAAQTALPTPTTMAALSATSFMVFAGIY